MENVQIIQCDTCGGPAYAEQQLEGFFCSYCENLMPWSSYSITNMSFRHRPIIRVDDLWKLTHVGLPEETVKDPRHPDELEKRTSDTNALLAALDPRTAETWETREWISFPCPNCGATIAGYSTQSIFECAYCKNKSMPEEVFQSGKYQQDLVFGYDFNMYDLALPFTITEEAAKKQMLELASRHPELFKGQDIAQRLETDLQAYYLPYRLEDISLKATVDTEKGKFTTYHERINWALPSSTTLDIYSLNELHPWDFGSVSPFTAAFLEGDVRIFAPVNNEERKSALRRLLWRETPPLIKDPFGLNKVKLLSWNYDFRRHTYAYLNLPIWFLDKQAEGSSSDLQISMAVNGQTGKAAVLFLQGNKMDEIRVLEAEQQVEMSSERSMVSPPVRIEYVKSPFLYRKLTGLEQKSNLGRLFGRFKR